MKTRIMAMVLLLSTSSFAHEVSNASSMADRIELRIQMIKEVQKAKTSTHHCSSNQNDQNSVGC